MHRVRSVPVDVPEVEVEPPDPPSGPVETLHWLAGVAFALFAAFCARLAPSAADRLGALIGDAAWWLAPSRRVVTRFNLGLAFPDLSPRERYHIARRAYRNLGRTLTEFCRLPRLDADWFREHVRIEGLEHLREVIERGEGALALSAHVGCFELVAATLNRRGLYRCSLVGRPIRNPWVEHVVHRLRASAGVATVPSNRGMREVFRRVRRDEGVGIVLDQRWKRSESVWCDFLGHPVPTSPALALMASRTGAPVIPLFMIREGPGRHVLRFLPIVELEEGEDRVETVRRNTRAYTEVIASVVREHPGQWMWLHSRWVRRKEILAGDPVVGPRPGKERPWAPDARPEEA